MGFPRLSFAVLIAAVIVASVTAQTQKPVIEVYKTPTCGCCALWVDHMKANGFTVKVLDMPDLSQIKSRYKVPGSAESCHTGVVNGYVIEGHVPASDVHRLLKEKKPVLGLAAPGMPMGAPGMEVPNPQPYDVLSIDKTGSLTIFASHRP